MSNLSRLIGWILVALSLFAVAETLRDIAFWDYGERKYAQHSPYERTFAFAGHTFSVADDVATDTTRSQTEYDGSIQPLMDGHPLAPPSHARVRRGLVDLGRYHQWYDVSVFTDRSTGDSSLWLARRLQESERSAPQFELTVVDAAGRVRRRVLTRWFLDWDFRVFRSTLLVAEGTWTVLPLSLTGFVFVPPLLLVFPIGSLLLGVLLVRRSRRQRQAAHVAG